MLPWDFFISEPAAEVRPETEQKLWAYIREVPNILRRDIRFRRFILVQNLTSFSLMVLPFYMVYATETFSIDTSYIGKYLLIQVVGMIVSNFVWGVVADLTDSRRLVRTCIYVGASIPVIAIFLANTNADLFGFVFFLLGFIISGRKISFEPYLLDIVPGQQRTEYLGIYGTLNIFIVILPFIGGLLITWFGYIPVFILVSLAMMLSGWMVGQNDPAPEDLTSYINP